MGKFLKFLNNVLDFMEAEGREVQIQHRRNGIEQGIGTFGSAGPYVDAEYYNEHGEYPYETRLREYNESVQKLNEEYRIEKSKEKEKSDLVRFE